MIEGSIILVVYFVIGVSWTTWRQNTCLDYIAHVGIKHLLLILINILFWPLCALVFYTSVVFGYNAISDFSEL